MDHRYPLHGHEFGSRLLDSKKKVDDNEDEKKQAIAEMKEGVSVERYASSRQS